MCGKSNYFACFAVILSLVAARQARSADPTLVGWWKFEEAAGTLYDESDFGNDGTGNGVLYQQAGQDGYALGFDGVDDTVPVGANGRPSDTFTFGGWFKTSSTHEIETESIAGTGGTSGQRYAFDPAHGGDSNGGAGLSIGTNGIAVYEHGSGYMPPTAVHQAEIGDDWNHIMVVYAAKQPTIYLNGELVRTGLTSPRASVQAPIQLGGMGYGYFEGLMDDVRIYNRALPQAEIAGLAIVLWASGPSPPDRSNTAPLYNGYEGDVFMVLDYAPGYGAIRHTAYFSDNFDDVNDRDADHSLGSVPPWPLFSDTAFVVGYANDPGIPVYAWPSLIGGKTYYWCIDEFDGTTTWPGFVWSFTVKPREAWGPTPTEGAELVSTNGTFLWNFGDLDPSGLTLTYNVYIGTDQAAVAAVATGDTASPLYAANVAMESYDYSDLEPETQHFWRVDTSLALTRPPFTATYTKGSVWSFTSAPAGVGGILREWWNDIGGTNAIADLKNHPRYPHEPDGSEIVTLFEGPTGIGDFYGTRLHGWLYVTLTGDYKFWIATDNEGELWLSTDENPDNANLISWVHGGWADPRQFDDPDVTPSGPITLQGGRQYYISGIMKENDGGDNIAVAWQGPDSGGSREVIPGKHLKPYIPIIASNPYPAHSSVDALLDVTLSWTAGIDESTDSPYTTQHVYLGSDPVNVANATTVSPEYKGAPTGPNEFGTLNLEFYEHVYWRVDGVAADAGTVVYPGSVWTFKALYDADNVCDPNLKLWLRFENDVLDYSGHGRDGTIYGGPTYIAGADGQAILFDGIDDYVNIEVPVGISGDDPRTIAGWVKATTTAISDWTTIFGFCPPWEAGYQYFDIEKIGGGNQYGIHIHGVQWGLIDVDLEWRHIAVTYEPGTAAAYIDGELLISLDTTGEVLNTVDIVRVGHRPSWNTYFPGSVDDVRIYDIAIAPPEIAIIMRLDPKLAWSPDPAHRAVDVPRDQILGWIHGDGATLSTVYIGKDDPANMVQVAGPQAATTYDPGTLDLGATYYWKVVENNAKAQDDCTPSRDPIVWKFTTAMYLTLDDMESYTPWTTTGNDIFVAWRDGEGDCTLGNGNQTGSTLTENADPVLGGIQSMKYDFDNDGMVYSPCSLDQKSRLYLYSKIEARVATLPSGIDTDWTIEGVKALSLPFHGQAGNATTESLWVQLQDAGGYGDKVFYGDYEGESPADFNEETWHDWNIDLDDFNIDLTNVVSIVIGIGTEGSAVPGGSGTLFFDEMRLYVPMCVPSRRSSAFAKADYAPEGDPDCEVNHKELEIMTRHWLQSDMTVNLEVLSDPVAWYNFENNLLDSTGNGNDGTAEGSPTYQPGRPNMGMAIGCTGAGGCVSTGKSAADLGIDGNKPRTITAWVYLRSFNNGAIFDVGNRANGEDFCLRTMGQDRWRIQYWGAEPASGDFDFTHQSQNQWVHFAHIHDGTYTKVYANGELVANVPRTINTSSANPFQIAMYGWTEFSLDARIDDLRVYDYALTHGQVLNAGGLTALYMPVTSPANISDEEPVNSKKVNFNDYAELLDSWLDTEEWPTW